MKKIFLITAIVGISLTGCKKEKENGDNFVAVTGITSVPTVAEVGKPLTLAATVAPENATNKSIEWMVKSAGTTDATITGNTLTAPTAGTVTATIAGGIAKNTLFTADFTVSVKNAEDMPVATGVTVSPATVSVAKGKTQKITATKQ